MTFCIPVLGTLTPSGDTSGTTDTAVLQGLLNLGPGIVKLSAGTFYITKVVSASATQRIEGAGRGQTIIAAVGTGDTIRMYNPNTPKDWQTMNGWSGGVVGLSIDGSSHTAGVSSGLHIGDGEEYDIDVFVMNFAGTGDIGLLMDNHLWWTEKCDVRAALSNNDTACVLGVSGTGSNSFEYNDLRLDIFANAGQNGLIIQNGAYMDNGFIRIRGNMTNGTSATVGTCLTVEGNNGTVNSHIYRSYLDIAIENDGVGTYGPQTIKLGPANSITNCNGILAFSGTNSPGWSPAAITSTTGTLTGTNQEQFAFAGVVYGDQTLCPGGSTAKTPLSGGPGLLNVGSPVIYAENLLDGSQGTIYDANGDFFRCTLSQDITVQLGKQSNGSITGPQRKLFAFTQAASGGPFTVKWPSTPPGTLPSHRSPTVSWPQAGTAPVMPTGAGEVMIVELMTFDGATWYGIVLAGAPTVAALPALHPASPTGHS